MWRDLNSSSNGVLETVMFLAFLTLAIEWDRESLQGMTLDIPLMMDDRISMYRRANFIDDDLYEWSNMISKADRRTEGGTQVFRIKEVEYRISWSEVPTGVPKLWLRIAARKYGTSYLVSDTLLPLGGVSEVVINDGVVEVIDVVWRNDDDLDRRSIFSLNLNLMCEYW